MDRATATRTPFCLKKTLRRALGTPRTGNGTRNGSNAGVKIAHYIFNTKQRHLIYFWDTFQLLKDVDSQERD